MVWLFPLWVNVVLGLTAVLLGLLYYFFTCNFDHWQKKGVKYEKGLPFFGSIRSAMILEEHIMLAFNGIYKKFQGEKFVGFFQGRSPALLVMDPELIKTIMVKDFWHFSDHGFRVHEEADPLEAKNLFNLEGQKWKEMRSKLTPTFTSGKIKVMTPLVEEVAETLLVHLSKIAKSNESFEAKDILSRFTTDVIGSCAFGIKCNSIENPKTEFREMGKKLVEFDFWRGIKAFIIMFLPEIGITFRFAFISAEVTNFFRKMVQDVMDLRKKTGQVRRDFMQLLIELKEKGYIATNDAEDEKETQELDGTNEADQNPTTTTVSLSHDDITAQATIFFIAGFETSSSVQSFACLEMAVNNDIQRKAQQEVDEALSNHGGRMTYEALKEMKYLECIIQETMRKYPPAGNIMRLCTKNYVIPGTDIKIDEGTPVMIPSYSLQNDPQYFPDPENFDPERFSQPNALHNYQYIHMPFGEGPRQCIGNRFALVQTKMGLAAILSKFDMSVSEPTQYPPVFDPKQFIVTPVSGIWLKVAARSEE